MCSGAAPAMTGLTVVNGMAPLMGNKSYRKSLAKLDAKTTPDFMKQTTDKLMPTQVRQEIIKKGGGDMLYNSSSEAVEASNRATEEENRQRVARAFAAKYNNQIKLL